MHVSTFHYVAWIIAPILQVWIGVLMYRRSLIREYPWFFAYTAFSVAQSLALVVTIRIAYAPYFYLFWITEGISCLLTLAVIEEVYQQAFRPFEGLKTFAGRAFKWGTLLLVLVAIVTALANSGSERDRFVAGLLILDRSAAFVQCGLLFLVFLLKQVMGLNWRQPSTGIAMGLGIIAASVAVSMTVRAYSTHADDPIVGLMMTLFYDVGVFTWIFALLKPQPEPGCGQLPEDEMLRKWNSALVEIMGR